MIAVSNRRTALILLPFIVWGFLIYSNTLDASFHYDDEHVVSDLSFKEMLERCKGGGRVVSHLTFLLNYWLGGTDVLGYHLFNTAIHIGTAYFVFIFLFQVLSIGDAKIPPGSNRHTGPLLPPPSDPVFWPSFLGGMSFLVHPLATQAVTYITQRYASLAGFFYIGSLAFFVTARIRFGQDKRFFRGAHLVPYLCSLVMAVLAMRSKEMAITLPAVVLLTEYYFLQSDFRAAGKRVLYLMPLLATGLIIPVSDIIGVETISLESVAAVQDYTWAEGIVTRREYLFTQFKIIAGIYLKLLVWPIGQNVDHDYAVSRTLFDLPTTASFLVLCIILGIGLWLFRHSRFTSFGILWFFVTISPTSSIVPNTEFVAEHRAYISLMGLAFGVAGLSAVPAQAGLPLWQSRWKRYFLIVLPALLLLSGLTYARNRVWQTGLTLWKDSVAKSQKKARPHNNLGIALAKQGSLAEAIDHLREAVRIKPYYAHAHNNLGNALAKHGNSSEAVSHLREAVRIKPDYAEARYNLGNALTEQGRFNDAVAHYSEALHIKPDHADAYYNLGLALCRMGKLNEAIDYFQAALRIKPDHADACNNIGVILARQGVFNEAIGYLQTALRIKPYYADAHCNMGNALVGQGRLEEAVRHYSEALRINPRLADARRNLAIVLQQMGNSAGTSGNHLKP